MIKPQRRKVFPKSKTPIRDALKNESALQGLVKDGLGAIERAHRSYFDESIRASFADSIDFDKALKAGREQDNRWDYILGHTPTQTLVGVEPHSAENGEISTVIRKLKAAREHLREHLRDGVHVSKWLWVASGKTAFVPMEKATLQLTQNGIKFVGNRIKDKHLR